MSTATLHRPLTACPLSQELLRHSLGTYSIYPHHVALASAHLFFPLLLCLLTNSVVTECVPFPGAGTLQHSEQSPPALSSVVLKIDLVLSKAVPECARASG